MRTVAQGDQDLTYGVLEGSLLRLKIGRALSRQRLALPVYIHSISMVSKGLNSKISRIYKVIVGVRVVSIFPKLPEIPGITENKIDQRNTRVKFTESELIDTVVVDSEGYMVGKIDSLRIEPEEIFIKLYGIEKEKRQVIDREALVERLAKIIPLKRRVFGGEPRSTDIGKIIRERMGIGPSEAITEEQIARYAESLGLSVPYTVQEREERSDRGAIPWALVDRVGTSDFGRCVILREPYEARKRGIEVKDFVPYQSKKELEGKLVVDSEAKPIGTALEILIGVTHGILVRKESYKQEETLDLDKLNKSLIPSRFNDFEDFKKKVGKDLDKKTVGIAEISAWCKRNNISLPTRRQTRVVADFEFSVDWRDIAKIGDVIILSRTIEELAQGQMSQKNLELLIQ
jgi:sporulation protein YlmC with PRC-barrel domain